MIFAKYQSDILKPKKLVRIYMFMYRKLFRLTIFSTRIELSIKYEIEILL